MHEKLSAAKMNSVPKTVFFTSCRGVFAGGGCRAAAHVGAFEAAVEAGINFSEVAGTSAGSIIAAFVGAGASPEFLRCHCGKLVFSNLLCKPTGTSVESGLLGRVLKVIPFLNRTLMGRIAMYGGAYSSISIEEWVDERISELLPNASRPVKFNALLLPTTIVATDLAGGRPKVWSTTTTPDESVALAVRCSCSISLFFEPVASGNSRFVDGGLLSNLPAFVFAESRSSGSLGGRVLAFSLQDDSKPPARWGHIELLHSLVGTIVGGATQLQTSMQSGVNVISIPTGDVRATDFNITTEKIDELIDSGREAVFCFIRDEALHLQLEMEKATWYTDKGNLLAELVREARTYGTDLVVVMPDTHWFWQLFPTVLAWREAGSSLKVLVEPPHGTADTVAREKQRRSILTDLGARVEEKKELPFYGFFLMRSDDHRESAFILNPSQTEHASYGTAYTGIHHQPLMRVIKKRLYDEFNNEPSAMEPCYLRSHQTDNIITRLKTGVWQYGRDGVTITLEEVPLNRVQMLVKKVRTFKFIQISHLASLYEKFDLPFFVPAAVIAKEKIVSVVTPPVFEEWGTNLVAIEGNTRLYYLYKEGHSKINALVVRGVTEPLPGHPVWPTQALLYTRTLESAERIAGFNYNQFRSIEGSARPLNT